jgi:hypothetical protein
MVAWATRGMHARRLSPAIAVGLLAIGTMAGCSNAPPAPAPTPIATEPTPAPTTNSVALGDPCLVGRWIERERRDANGISLNNQPIPTKGLAGFVITFSASGTETDDFAKSKPLVGHWHGERYTVEFRGHGVLRAHAAGGIVTESGRRQPLTAFGTLGGRPIPQSRPAISVGTYAYSCSATHLTLTTTSNSRTHTTDDLVRATKR